jgi:Anti-sigma factor NepR
VSKKQPRRKPTIGRLAQDRIGRELRVMYGEVLREPLPEELSSVLQAFQGAEAAQHRLQAAVQILQRVKLGLVRSADIHTGASLVHAQQRLVELSMRAARAHRRERAPGIRDGEPGRRLRRPKLPRRLTAVKRASTA